MGGPVKTATRMIAKLEEYIQDEKPFPRAACVIDVLRLTISFDTGDQVLGAFKLLEENDGKGAYKMVRYKNKYRKDSRGAAFRNLMVNLQFEPVIDGVTYPIICEIQLTTVKSV